MVDTVNLDPSRKKATPKDEAVLNKVEAALGEGETKKESRATLLLRLSSAKGDVSGFTTAMLMRKDMKVDRNSLENQSVVFFEIKPGVWTVFQVVYTSKEKKVSVSTVPVYSCRKLLERGNLQEDVK